MADIYPKDVTVQGYSGTGTVVFSGRIKYGSGTTGVSLHVTPEDILNMARLLLLAGKQHGAWCVGHAIYHRADGLLRHELPLPCSSCAPDPSHLKLADRLGQLLGEAPAREEPEQTEKQVAMQQAIKLISDRADLLRRGGRKKAAAELDMLAAELSNLKPT